jgi:DNA-binding transcriptional regulator YiaG
MSDQTQLGEIDYNAILDDAEKSLEAMRISDLIEAVGEVLFGSHWQSDLARALGVHRVTVQRWRREQEAPRLGAWLNLLKLVEARIAELTEIRTRLLASR